MRLKILLLFSLTLNVLLFSVFVVFSIRYNWYGKLAERVGLKEATKTKDYYTTTSWNNSIESLCSQVDVVFFGASLTSNGRWHEYFDTLKVCNLGKSGDELTTMLWRVPQITSLHPQKIFLAPEQNDLQTSSVPEIRLKLLRLLYEIRDNNPQAEIYLISLTPLNQCQFKRVCDNEKIRRVNDVIKKIAIEEGLVYINIYDLFEVDGQLPMTLSYDGQHLLSEAYLRWVEAIRIFI